MTNTPPRARDVPPVRRMRIMLGDKGTRLTSRQDRIALPMTGATLVKRLSRSPMIRITVRVRRLRAPSLSSARAARMVGSR